MRVVQYTQNESNCLRMDWIQLTGTHMSQETCKNTHRLAPNSHLLIVQVEVIKQVKSTVVQSEIKLTQG